MKWVDLLAQACLPHCRWRPACLPSHMPPAPLRSRRPAWTLVPWDPTALPLLYKKHQEVYSELQVWCVCTCV
jgi:hypothetical protein